MGEARVEVQVLADCDAANEATAELFVQLARDAVRERGRFVVALSGGKTPQPVHALLATSHRDRVPWEQVHAWFGDERCVPPDDRASNFGMARRALLDHVPIPPSQVHRLQGELAPGLAADRADAELRAFAATAPDGVLFDLMMLGAGADGHTASLFPGNKSLEERTRMVMATRAPDGMEVKDRLTMTLPVLSDARVVALLATGTSKRDALRRAEADGLPVGRVHGRERTVWIVDRDAWGA